PGRDLLHVPRDAPCSKAEARRSDAGSRVQEGYSAADHAGRSGRHGLESAPRRGLDLEPRGFFYLLGRRKRKRRSSGSKPSSVNWYLMRPCVGVNGVCPALCTWAQLNDGTYSLEDVERFNQAIDELVRSHREAIRPVS